MDKKLRRQIANSNERRRMQSINQGFHSLRLLMPHLQGEKLSKVCILLQVFQVVSLKTAEVTQTEQNYQIISFQLPCHTLAVFSERQVQ
jgi:transcription factor AP-4